MISAHHECRFCRRKLPDAKTLPYALTIACDVQVSQILGSELQNSRNSGVS